MKHVDYHFKLFDIDLEIIKDLEIKMEIKFCVIT